MHRSRRSKTKPIYQTLQLSGDMDTSSFFTLLQELVWILAMVGAGIGVVYILVKPEEKK